MNDEHDPAYVKVTLETIYNKLLDVETKVNPVPEIVKDHEARIRKIEIQTAIQWVGFGALTLAFGATVVRAVFP